jgi:DNA-binding Lrp family transcriptional regulator
MPIAYVLLNCSLGSEEKVIEQLKQIESVKEVNGTFGTYDILAKLQASNIEELRNGISSQIRNIDNVTGTLTLMGIKDQEQISK